jgi:hypothetical protein
MIVNAILDSQIVTAMFLYDVHEPDEQGNISPILHNSAGPHLLRKLLCTLSAQDMAHAPPKQ